MDVIGVGLGRTGTASLKTALEQIGFGPCYHMMEVLDQPERVRQWRRIGDADGQGVNWDAVFAGYRSTVDWPGAGFWRELVEAYPDAKVILTVRDPERWFDSALRTVFQFPIRRRGPWERRAFNAVVRWNPPSGDVPLMLDTVMWKRTFDGHMFGRRPGDRELALAYFQRHIDAVRHAVDPERLLVFDVGEGWRPLCEFLGVDVPAEPFPKVNDANAFLRMLAARRRSAVLRRTPEPWKSST
jgi:hypothetical protein